MPLYRVAMEDLEAVQAALTTQANGLGTTQAGTQQAVAQLNDGTTQALVTGRTSVTQQLEALTTEVNRSNELATAAHWTGPDSDRFRQSNTELLTAIQQTTTRFEESIALFETATTSLMAVLGDLVAEFTAATAASQESSTRLSSAVQIEAQSYEEAFNGSFAYGG